MANTAAVHGPAHFPIVNFRGRSNKLICHIVYAMTGISSVDVGNYSCEVGGPRNTVLASVTHQLNVRGLSPPTSVDSLFP